jgi:NTE family protein
MNAATDTAATTAPEGDDLALVLVGGGARAAYQVGFLRSLVRRHPDIRLPIITGTSAGAINAAYLAARTGSVAEAVEELERLWSAQTVDQVFRVDSRSLFSHLLRWGIQLVSGGAPISPHVQGLLDTAPLRMFLNRTLHPAENGEIEGIARNIETGRLRALAITTSSYSTGQSVIWVQGGDIEDWERPNRRSRKTAITVDHIMASSALPLFFPAIRLDDGWYGDGGIRMVTPCSPAIHLGARRILAVSNRYRRTIQEADRSLIRGYPPPAQIAGPLIQAMFLDDLDRDRLNLERLNQLLEALPPERRRGLRPVELVVIRPSRDFGRLAGEFEPRLPWFFRHLTRGLGSRETASPDLLSLLMFQTDYIARLMEIGEADAEAEADRVSELLDSQPSE